MGNQFDPGAYIQNLYTALEAQYRNDTEWTDWNNDRLYFMKEYVNNRNPREMPDACFLSALCFIARKDKSQDILISAVMPKFLNNYGGDLRNIQTDNDCKNLGLYPKLVPYQWLINLSSHLREEHISFTEFLHNVEGLSGLEIRDELIRLIGSQSNFVKRISVFIRDFLEKDTFGIDLNVRNVLRNVGLPLNEDVLVNRCRSVDIDPGRLERLFYLHGKRMCQNKSCNTCPINTNCSDYRFNI